jgi:UDP-glucuronate 4-epimerase
MILITGCAGFIGFHVALKFLSQGKLVFGIDNLNNYYDQDLKKKRLKILNKNKNFIFKKIDISKPLKLNKKFEAILHFAAQPGVRYTIDNPYSYISSNIIGTFNILEFAKKNKIQNLIIASSSSVYGLNKIKNGFKENQLVDKPMQIYSASKITNELMSFSYTYLNNMKIVALRFFSVYGPWGRPDMAVYKFCEAISNQKKIELYNNGNNFRDYTYISDVVDGVIKTFKYLKKTKKNFTILNLGNSRTYSTKHLLFEIEKNLSKKAKIKFTPNLKEDILKTKSNLNKVRKLINYNPKVSLTVGIKKFTDWYKEYAQKK